MIFSNIQNKNKEKQIPVKTKLMFLFAILITATSCSSTEPSPESVGLIIPTALSMDLPTPEPTENSGNLLKLPTPVVGTVALDFSDRPCSASWSNNGQYLPCPGNLDEISGGYRFWKSTCIRYFKPGHWQTDITQAAMKYHDREGFSGVEFSDSGKLYFFDFTTTRVTSSFWGADPRKSFRAFIMASKISCAEN